MVDGTPVPSGRGLAVGAHVAAEQPSRLAAVVAHEFRTPLATILAITDTLDGYAESMTPTQRRERLAGIRTQVSQMVRLLDDVVSFGCDQAGGAPCRPQRIDVAALCREIMAEIESSTARTHALVFSPRGGAREASVDPALFRRIVGNLLSNAVKYSPAGSEVGVELEATDRALLLRVRDHGIGIEPQDRATLFEPFRRGRNVGARPGTGLGLSIAEQAVRLHGGTIAVDSAPGAGSTFEVRFPAERAPA